MLTREGMQTDAFKDKQKERILEIRKQQIEKKLHTEENVNVIRYSKKPFPKLVLIIIIFCIFALYAIEFLPWLHVESFDGSFNIDIYRNLKGGAGVSFISFFKESTSLSNGILKDYFYTNPTNALYGVSGILVLSSLMLIFGFIDKKKDFSIIDYNLGKFIFNSLILLPTIYLMYSVVVFFGSYLVMARTIGTPSMAYQLYPWMEEGLHWSYPTPYILIMGGFIIIIICFTEMDSSLRRILHELDRNYLKKKKTYKKQKIST